MIGGDDFKSGQTKMKSVLVDFLVGAGIKVYNILRNRNYITFCANCVEIDGGVCDCDDSANINSELQPSGKQ